MCCVYRSSGIQPGRPQFKSMTLGKSKEKVPGSSQSSSYMASAHMMGQPLSLMALNSATSVYTHMPQSDVVEMEKPR